MATQSHRASGVCRLCGGEAREVARQRVLGRHEVAYWQCAVCDLIQTEEPYWLEEAYEQAISRLDTGAMQRNRETARLTALVARLVAARGACLDFGGGHGVFARMMRDLGFDFRWFDRYAENLFAEGFEGEVSRRYELVTAFEVLEHFADVRGDLDLLFAPGHDVVLVGTLLHDGHKEGWWYYLPDTGQHVAFYSRDTLEWIADRYGYEVMVGPQASLFVRRDVAMGPLRRALLRRLLRRPRAARLVPRGLLDRGSLVESDHNELRARLDD